MVALTMIDTNLNKVEEISLSDSIFCQEPHDHAIYQVVRKQLAARRRGTAKTKTRGEVIASTAKPYRQKGTGRARAGSARSPLWVGGGTIFGPIPRSFDFKLPKKIKRLALLSTLSQKYVDGDIIVINELAIAHGKTKEFVEIWQKLVEDQQVKTLFVIPEKDELLWRSSRNVGLVKLTFPDKLNVYDLLNYKKLVIVHQALTQIEEVYS